MDNIGLYSLGVFLIVLASACVVNLLKNHFVIQLAGITLFFSFSVLKAYSAVRIYSNLSLNQLYLLLLPMLAGTSACLVSMVLGFWVFPPIRRKFKN